MVEQTPVQYVNNEWRVNIICDYNRREDCKELKMVQNLLEGYKSAVT